jgi:hypothetical protein
MWQDLLATVVTTVVEYVTQAILGPIITWILGLFGFGG